MCVIISDCYLLHLKLLSFSHFVLCLWLHFYPVNYRHNWKRPWCWEGLGAGREGADRGWDGWMASPTRWAWVWVNSGSWWWTGRPGVLRSMGLQRAGHDWVTELNWTTGQGPYSFATESVVNCSRQKFYYSADNLKFYLS